MFVEAETLPEIAGKVNFGKLLPQSSAADLAFDNI